MKKKLYRILKEMEKVWDMTEGTDRQQELPESFQMKSSEADSQRQRKDVATHITQQETEMKGNMQRQKEDIDSKLAQAKCEREEIYRIRGEIQMEKEKLERDQHLATTEMALIKNMRLSMEKQKLELDDQLESTMKKMRKMEIINSEIDLNKNNLVKMIKMSKKKKEMLQGEMEVRENQPNQRSEEESTTAWFDERDIQQVDRTRNIMQYTEYRFNNTETSTEKVNTGMHRVILEVEEIRKMLQKVREDSEKSRREIMDEKRQIKWMNFHAKKQRRVLDQNLEKTIKERDELELLKITIQQQRQEVEQKLQHAVNAILTMSEMKTSIEKATEEMDSTREEMLKAQMLLKENKDEVKKFMVSRYISSFYVFVNLHL